MEKNDTPAGLLVRSFQNPELQDKSCLVDALTCRSFSYADMEEETSLAAGIIRSLHIAPGETVSLLLENGVHFFMPWIGAMRAGARVHPVNCLYTDEQVIYALALCETRLLITQERYAWDKEQKRPSQLLEKLFKKFPALRIVVMNDAWLWEFKSEKPFAAKGCPAYCWNTLKKFVRSDHYVAYRRPSDPFQLICTSGTSGKPKAVVQHIGMVLPDIEAVINCYGLNAEDRTLLVNRLFHVNAQYTNFLPMALLGGTTVLSSSNAKCFLAEIDKWHITYSSVIPPFLKSVLTHPVTPKSGRPKLRFIIAGADILTEEFHKKFMDSTGIVVRPGWGMTENGCWGSGSPVYEPVAEGSIGQPLPCNEFRIIDPVSLTPAGNNVKGELWISGPNVFRDYFRDTEATCKSFMLMEDKVWFKTGDICYRDDDGNYFFCYRASADAWKVRGEFVNGPETDELIKTFPAVADAMAVPVPINGETETVLCAVSELPEEEILALCEEARASGKLERHIKIKKVILVNAVLLGDTGKRSRKKMSEFAQKFIDNLKNSETSAVS